MAQPAREFAMMSVSEFLLAELPEGKSELVRGEIRMNPPPGAPHGRVATNLVVLLSAYAQPRRIGLAFGDSVGYELVKFPHTVRVPDASFVLAERIPPEGVRPGLFRFAPDLAIEVLSPSERATALEEKLQDYVGAGTSLIWVVDPVKRTIMTVSPDAPVGWLSERDTLDGGKTVPGFSCPVEEVFAWVARA